MNPDDQSSIRKVNSSTSSVGDNLVNDAQPTEAASPSNMPGELPVPKQNAEPPDLDRILDRIFRDGDGVNWNIDK